MVFAPSRADFLGKKQPTQYNWVVRSSLPESCISCIVSFFVMSCVTEVANYIITFPPS